MGTVWKMKSWRGVQSVRKTGNGGGRVAGERGYGVMFSPYGSMVLDPSTLSSSGSLDLQHILLAAL